ncbi:AAA family ATPase [Paenibacillus sp. BSR1-1]|uniref:AAA family ATPase n=1 Tax=Paenibacillus sp. BSR1-1 TaxID=3020845 RepID=UPI0025B12267|nr:AAA family ATPase [Paenibacillus sp. BSR1-1]MDN3015796.1 AAA family ATPase [Paenibacillus sp. BSR1-1]
MEYFDFFKTRNFIFSDEMLTNFALSLKTKPFLILSGISGSGKSKIAELFSEYLVDDLVKQITFMSVKPNWKDSKDLLGYHNLITGEYETTPFLKLLIRAAQEPDKPFFLLLDEMNLAKVEHYFSDFLSCIESRKYDTVPIIPSDSEILKELTSSGQKLTLSQAQFLSALHLKNLGFDVENEFLDVDVYRKTIFIDWWFSKSKSKTPEEQFRVEFNQPGRLAHTIFESPGSGGRKYRLKDLAHLDPKDREPCEKLITFYESIVKITKKKIVIQQPIILHSKDNSLLSTDSAYPPKNNYTVSSVADWYDEATNTYFIPSKLEIPLNIFVIGTVNVDETTYMFSPKVLDRANLIEFNDVNILSISPTFGIAPVTGTAPETGSAPETGTAPETGSDSETGSAPEIGNAPETGSASETGSAPASGTAPGTGITASEPYKLQNDPVLLPLELATLEISQTLANSTPNVMDDLLEVYKLLEKFNLHFGYRVINEISLYITNAEKSVTSYPNLAVDALDFQFLQKVLPKFNGSIQKLWEPFVNILSYIRNSKATPLQADEFKGITRQLFSKELENVTNIDYRNVFKYPRTAKKLLYLLRNLENNGFTSFIE